MSQEAVRERVDASSTSCNELSLLTHSLLTDSLIRAEVAELAYAPVSKTGHRKVVWVQFPPSAFQRVTRNV